MRIALLYPPPWKIPMPGEPADVGGDGPPTEYAEGDLDADFFQTPYGLFALGAQALELTDEEIAALERAIPPDAASGDRYPPQQMAVLDSERPGA